jgi:hypothetical protein
MKLVAKQKGSPSAAVSIAASPELRTLATRLLSLSIVFGRRVALRKT